MSDFDELRIRIARANGSYRVEAAGVAGTYRDTFTLPFDARDVELFLLRVSGRGRTATRRIESSERQLIADFGGKLFDALFTGDVGVAYRVSRAEAERDSKSLRVTLSLLDAPELMQLPWEYLYDDPEFLAISKWTPVLRYVAAPGGYEPLKIDLPLRILAMVSSPDDAVELDTERERANLQRALSGLVERGAVEIDWLEEATLQALLRKLQRGPFHVFHYVGHGAYDAQAKDGVLLLEDENNRARPVTGRDLGVYLGDHKTLRLAVINACEGARTADDDPFAGVAMSLVQRKIPAVIAMQFEITDSAAIAFAGEFYWKLADCGVVDTALAFARQAIYATNEVEWATPVLFMRVPDGRIFDVPDAPLSHPEPAPAPPRQIVDEPTPAPTPNGRRRGTAVLVGAATALGAVAAVVLGLVVFNGSTNGRGGATTATTTGTTTNRIGPKSWTLRAALPASVRKACSSSSRLNVPGALDVRIQAGASAHFAQAFACASPAPGISLVQYSVARTREDLDAYLNWRAYAARLESSRFVSTPPLSGTCGTTSWAVNDWARVGAMGHEALPTGGGTGRVICYVRGSARIEWTDPRRLVYGYVQASDPAAAFRWWATRAGPRAGPG